jgi:hypothetical protein
MTNTDGRDGGAAPTEAELRCPRCGERGPLRIVYGLPSHPAFEASERGEFALGGCVVSIDSPSWQCRRCGREWANPPGPQGAYLAAWREGRDS